MSSPRVTVLMPVYNGAAYLAEAVRSILDQTFTDFELLIIDDGSTDQSAEIIRSFSDPRIRLHHNGRNLGLIATLNKGLSLAAGDYIARMDCDDVSLPTRLERQVNFMDRNPDIGIAGSWFERLEDGGSRVARNAVDDAMIRFFLIFDNSFLHSSMMLRRAFLERHGLRYDPDFHHAEDYEFWVRCGRYTRLANIPEVLVRYRYHPENISYRFRGDQAATADRVRCLHLEALGIPPNDEQARIHLDLLSFRFQGDLDRARAAAAWLDTVAAVIRTRLGLSERLWYDALEPNWYGVCGAAAHQGMEALRLFRSHPAGQRARWQWSAKLLLRCLLGRRIEL